MSTQDQAQQEPLSVSSQDSTQKSKSLVSNISAVIKKKKKQQCLELLAQGMSQADVARKLGIHPGTIGSWAFYERQKQKKQQKPKKIRTPSLNHPKFAEGKKMLEAGATNMAVVAALRVTGGTVAGWRKALGIAPIKGRPGVTAPVSNSPPTAVEALAAIPVPKDTLKTDVLKLALRYGTEKLRALLDDIEHELL